MSKGRNRTRRTRDASNIAKTAILRSPIPITPSSTYLSQIEDRRTFHPEGPYRPARSFDKALHSLDLSENIRRDLNEQFARDPLPRQFPSYGRPVRTFRRRVKRRSAQRKSWSLNRSFLAFRDPARVLICVRRKMRREVLHALRKTGQGGSQRKPRRNWYSAISCVGGR